MKKDLIILFFFLISITLIWLGIVVLSSGGDFSTQSIDFGEISACKGIVADKQKVEDELFKAQADMADYLKGKGFKDGTPADVVDWSQNNKVDTSVEFMENVQIFKRNGLSPILVILHVGRNEDVCESGVDILWDGNYFLSRIRNNATKREQFYNELESWWEEYEAENFM